MSKDSLKAIRLQVMWNRLIAVVEEQAQALLRTAFGHVAREAGDLSAGVYDVAGRMLAQAVTGTPGHVNTMAAAVGHFLERFPVATMAPGDVYVTNDPWLGTGHLFDFVAVTPAFRDGRPVALFASTCHMVDVGGIGFSADANSVFEEGTLIPHLRLRAGDRLNEDILAIVTANSRNPTEVRGDILSLVSCNDVGVARLLGMMAEFDLTSIDELARHVIEKSREATLSAIKRVPPGIYGTEMQLDGYDAPILLRAKMTVSEREIVVDYAGSSPASLFGINSPKCYTDAYTVFGLKCAIAPSVPNNAGSLAPFKVLAEPGSIVDPVRPSPVTARHVVGQMLPDVAFGCLAQALPDAVPAESAGSIWVLAMASAHERVADARLSNAARFNVMNVGLGGVGARPGKDGLSTTAFPSGVGTIPIEVTEDQCPLVFWRKEYLRDSGGPGTYRGGLGQVIEIGNSEEAAFTISAATFDRIRFPPRGRNGGHSGGVGAARLGSGAALATKATHVVPAGDRLVVELPGGGGLGEPTERPPERVKADIAAGLVSPEAALRVYGLKSGM
ncbi:MAG: hydantoinase B/oxoprolinase family protein [Proteobacteria bacterium]|nr:hydantoinase B/oxoprolinase family protein [Pseudomonadota bacterium]MBI3497429.1 hydantoinase B/oxoprolinase family protein [Pseudomonadota bacterium]